MRYDTYCFTFNITPQIYLDCVGVSQAVHELCLAPLGALLKDLKRDWCFSRCRYRKRLFEGVFAILVWYVVGLGIDGERQGGLKFVYGGCVDTSIKCHQLLCCGEVHLQTFTPSAFANRNRSSYFVTFGACPVNASAN